MDCLLPSFSSSSHPSAGIISRLITSAAAECLSELSADTCSSSFVNSYVFALLLWPLWPLAPAGFWRLLISTMRSLLESSWMRFGPAGRDSLDWSTVPSALPSTDRQATGQSSGEAILSVGSITYIAIATASFLLIFLSIFGFHVCRRKRGFSLDGKLDLTNVIALEDLQDPEKNCELLSSLRGNRGQQLSSCSSEQDMTDGVFLMVYLPSPYEQTLTRIARAASTSSSKDLELPPSTGPETGCRDAEEIFVRERGIAQDEVKD